MPWLALAQLYLAMFTILAVTLLALMWVQRHGLHLPPDDPTRQFTIARRALARINRRVNLLRDYL